MEVKYFGPREEIIVAPHGPHRKGAVKEYPDDFAEELLATSVKQHFEPTGKSKKSEPESETEEKEIESEEEEAAIEIGESPIVLAARAAIDAGKITKDGKPLVEAMEEMLGSDITATERDEVWEKLQNE